jgi:hypothetical protein
MMWHIIDRTLGRVQAVGGPSACEVPIAWEGMVSVPRVPNPPRDSLEVNPR